MWGVPLSPPNPEGGEPQSLLSPNLPPGGFLAVSWVRCEQMTLSRVHPPVCPTIIQHLSTYVSIHLSVLPSVSPSDHLSIHPPIHSLTHFFQAFIHPLYPGCPPQAGTVGSETDPAWPCLPAARSWQGTCSDLHREASAVRRHVFCFCCGEG